MESSQALHVALFDPSLCFIEEIFGLAVGEEVCKSSSQDRDQTVLLILVVENSAF